MFHVSEKSTKKFIYFCHSSDNLSINIIMVLFNRLLVKFISALFTTFTDLYFTYLEINPLGMF